MKPIPAYIQKMIAATNGRHYQGLIGRLKTLPIPELPERVKAEVSKSREKPWMLDIGSGWGRWLLAGANAGFVPVGLELKLEAARVAKELLQREGRRGFVVVADAGKPPFAPESFDVIWSFSVLQHLHRMRAKACLERCAELLKRGGLLAIELPTKFGIRNRFIRYSQEKEEDNWDSWVVRYYTISEIKEILKKLKMNLEIQAHSFGGIGFLKNDLKFVTTKYKVIIFLSEALRKFSKPTSFLVKFADSIYVYSRKELEN